MKKKLLFIPIVTLAISFLIGCEHKEEAPIYIESFLNSAKTPDKDPNAPEFWYKDDNGHKYGDYDYGLVIRDAISSKVKGIEPIIENNIKEATESTINYQIRTYFAHFNCCIIYIYEDGYIGSNNYGSGWGAPKSQHFLYNIGETNALDLINIIKARCLEIKTIKQAELTEGKIDNFFKQIEDSKETPTIAYHETRPDHESYDVTTYDNDRALLNSFKDLEYKEIEDSSFTLSPTIKYYIREDWQLQIYCGYGDGYNIAFIHYKYEGSFKTYYPAYYTFYYSINATKAEAIVDTIYNNHQ